MSKYKSKIRVFESVSKFKHVTPPKDSFKSGEKQPTNPHRTAGCRSLLQARAGSDHKNLEFDAELKGEPLKRN